MIATVFSFIIYFRVFNTLKDCLGLCQLSRQLLGEWYRVGLALLAAAVRL